METEKGQITRIYNGEIITPERNFGVGTVLIAEGKIIGNEYGSHSEVTFRSDDFTVINSGYLSFFSFHNSDQ